MRILLGCLLLPVLLIDNGRAGLEVHEVRVRSPLIFGLDGDLSCRFGWTSSSVTEAANGTAYSVKWYKDGEEFYRYVPSEDPPIVSFPRVGLDIDESLSNLTHVRLRRVDWSSAGLFRCEVTSDQDYEMIFTEEQVDVIAIPREAPIISGYSPTNRYSLGDTVDLNCTSNSSDPLPDIHWYINNEQALPFQLVEYPWVRERTNLMTKTLGLRFRLAGQHIDRSTGGLTAKCVVILGDVFFKASAVELKVEAKAANRKNKFSVVSPMESRRGMYDKSKELDYDSGGDLSFSASDIQKQRKQNGNQGFFGMSSNSVVSSAIEIVILGAAMLAIKLA